MGWKPRCIHWHHIKMYCGIRQKIGYVVRRIIGYETPSADIVGCKHTGTLHDAFMRGFNSVKDDPTFGQYYIIDELGMKTVESPVFVTDLAEYEKIEETDPIINVPPNVIFTLKYSMNETDAEYLKLWFEIIAPMFPETDEQFSVTDDPDSLIHTIQQKTDEEDTVEIKSWTGDVVRVLSQPIDAAITFVSDTDTTDQDDDEVVDVYDLDQGHI